MYSIHVVKSSALITLFALGMGTAAADPFCCECKDGKKHLLDESNIAMAGSKCSLKCKRPTLPEKGACEAPTPAPAAAAPSPAPKATAGAAALFKSEDCSGESVRIEKSEAQLGAGMLSYQVDSGLVSAYAKPNFAGASTQPIVGSMCVSPGFAIGSVKIGQ